MEHFIHLVFASQLNSPHQVFILQKCRGRGTLWWAWEPLWRQAYHGDFYWEICLAQAADMVHLKRHSATHLLQCTFLEKNRENNKTQVWIWAKIPKDSETELLKSSSQDSKCQQCAAHIFSGGLGLVPGDWFPPTPNIPFCLLLLP